MTLIAKAMEGFSVTKENKGDCIKWDGNDLEIGGILGRISLLSSWKRTRTSWSTVTTMF